MDRYDYKLYKVVDDSLVLDRYLTKNEVLDMYSKYEGNSIVEDWGEDGDITYLRMDDTVIERVVG